VAYGVCGDRGLPLTLVTVMVGSCCIRIPIQIHTEICTAKTTARIFFTF